MLDNSSALASEVIKVALRYLISGASITVSLNNMQLTFPEIKKVDLESFIAFAGFQLNAYILTGSIFNLKSGEYFYTTLAGASPLIIKTLFNYHKEIYDGTLHAINIVKFINSKLENIADKFYLSDKNALNKNRVSPEIIMAALNASNERT